MALEEFQAGTAIYVEMNCKDKDGVLADPANGPTITLIDALGETAVDEQAMTKKDGDGVVGVYWYVYQSSKADTLGVWKSSYAATSDDGAKAVSVPTPVFELV
jgi:hypothetical protein